VITMERHLRPVRAVGYRVVSKKAQPAPHAEPPSPPPQPPVEVVTGRRPSDVIGWCCGYTLDWCCYGLAFLALLALFVGVVLLIIAFYGNLNMGENVSWWARLALILTILLIVALILSCGAFATMVCCGCGGKTKKTTPRVK
jgi:hypothetical protein